MSRQSIFIIVVMCIIGFGIVDVSWKIHDVKTNISKIEMKILSDELSKYASIHDCKTLYISKTENNLSFDCIK